ncbi:DUF3131 domain-containing protein [Desulfoluna spongiiphila]|uniref:DUF3131 domain-containing protein n=1 Tax=Desulfoluna spongiiphila TaxID=419481 RepID=A0A1G5B245_9BACT|nr:DUF3131 domain-containing protein [Desulfoluna spongiiphila]SCX84257.1 Protein of unknown function [Desulfoluna spongiiphila]
MTFTQGLLRARSHIVFLLGLVAAFGTVIALERAEFKQTPVPAIVIEETADLAMGQPSPLSETEMAWARIAWTYFENNLQENGLVNSVDGYTATTLWDTASYMMALISAHRLGILGEAPFHDRMGTLLETMEKLPLFEGTLPNKSYNTVTGAMVDYDNQPTQRGIGWSAIDIGRLLTPMNILIWNYPRHTPRVAAILSAWDFQALIRKGSLYGAALDDNDQTIFLQEGRVGYEQYAAKSLALMGLDVSRALSYTEFLSFVDVFGIQVPHDSRDPEIYHAHNYVVSEPFILDALEYGWDETSREFAYRVFKAQERRYLETGTLTAVSEDNIDTAPWFVYNTVFTDGEIWNCITEDGKDASAFKSLSTKAAFGWHCIYDTDYTRLLMAAVEGLNNPEKGWFSGLYEKQGVPNRAITCNTNAIVLESLCRKHAGQLVAIHGPVDAGKPGPHRTVRLHPEGETP